MDAPGVAAQGHPLLAGLRLPDLRASVGTGGRHRLAVRTEGHAPDDVRMSVNAEPATRVGVPPQLGAPVPAPREEALAVGAERDAVDVAGVAAQRRELSAIRCVPDLDRAVSEAAAGSDPLPVGAEGRAADGAGVPAHGPE